MDKLVGLIKNEFRVRVIEESLMRIIKCLDQLDHNEIWHKQNANTNSVGNLILHLSGNVGQYIVAGLGNAEDTRDRDSEFREGHTHSAASLKKLITDTLTSANEVVQELDSEQMTHKITIQGFDHTYLSAIIHVIEHLSYHVGQITYYTKYIKNLDTGYYSGLDLNITG